MQEIRNSNPPVVTGICDPNKSRAWHHRTHVLIPNLIDKIDLKIGGKSLLYQIIVYTIHEKT